MEEPQREAGMTPQRWRRIEELYHSAREHGAGVLAGADPELQRDVEELLAQDSGNKILDQAATDLVLDSTQTQVMVGSQLGPYKIEGVLGAGGMGPVYRATDTRLGRSVAVKISDEKFSNRFEREARAIAALNHPHICTLHDVGPNYLVMELVEGQTLRDWLKLSPPPERCLEIARQVLEALRAAHGEGIVHRDLKPAIQPILWFDPTAMRRYWISVWRNGLASGHSQCGRHRNR
jgi:hypothetical protein